MTLFASLPYDTESRSAPARHRWFPDLYLRPDEYFKSVVSSRQTFPILLMWLCGIAPALERDQTRRLMGDILEHVNLFRGPLGSWVALWTGAIIIGAFSGILLWLIGGWWFRMRLLLSGAHNPDPLSARLVYIHAYSAWAIPFIVLQLTLVTRYFSALQARPDTSFWLTNLVLPFWSIYLSYRGAVSCFEVRRTPARVWFLILPSGLFSLVLVLLLVSGFASAYF